MTSYYLEGQSTAAKPNGITGIHITHVFFMEDSQYNYVENYAFSNPELATNNAYAL
jgi:hypothetical protein